MSSEMDRSKSLGVEQKGYVMPEAHTHTKTHTEDLFVGETCCEFLILLRGCQMFSIDLS